MKKIRILTLSFFLLCSGVYADMPVIDLTNVLQAIEQGYTMYQQLQAMYNQIQNSYAQLQQQIENYKGLRMDKLDAQDPLGSWRSLMTYADRLMTYEENIENIMKTKSMKWGRNNFSLADVYSKAPFGEDGYLKGSFDDPFERELTTEEKAMFHSKYGISYGHYMRYNMIGEQICEKAGEAKTYFDYQMEQMNEDRKKLDTIASTTPETESIVAEQQKNNALTTVMAQDIKTVSYELAIVGKQLTDQAYLEELQRQDAENYENTLKKGHSKTFEKMMLDEEDEEDFK